MKTSGRLLNVRRRWLTLIGLVACVTAGLVLLEQGATAGQHRTSSITSCGGSGPKKALIDGTTVLSGCSSLEAQQALALGFQVALASSWNAPLLSTATFASYQVLIIGDPSCGLAALSPSTIQSAPNWVPAVMGTTPGNRIVIGTMSCITIQGIRPTST
jgi:hypothetical protein